MVRSLLVNRIQEIKQRKNAATEAVASDTKVDTHVATAEKRVNDEFDKLKKLDAAKSIKDVLSEIAEKSPMPFGIKLERLEKNKIPIFEHACEYLLSLPKLLTGVKGFMKGDKALKDHLAKLVDAKMISVSDNTVCAYHTTPAGIKEFGIDLAAAKKAGGFPFKAKDKADEKAPEKYTARNFVEFISENKDSLSFSSTALRDLLKTATDEFEASAKKDDGKDFSKAKAAFDGRIAAIVSVINTFTHATAMALMILEIANEEWCKEKKK